MRFEVVFEQPQQARTTPWSIGIIWFLRKKHLLENECTYRPWKFVSGFVYRFLRLFLSRSITSWTGHFDFLDAINFEASFAPLCTELFTPARAGASTSQTGNLPSQLTFPNPFARLDLHSQILNLHPQIFYPEEKMVFFRRKTCTRDIWKQKSISAEL